MKRALIYVGILIIITGLLILFVSKNYPENIFEICLEEYKSPEEIEHIMEEINVFDYFNIYEIFSKEGTASVYSGNLNLFLKDKKREDNGLTYDTKEVIIGRKFADKNIAYYPLGEKYRSVYGEYDINCILEGNDRVYYRDLEILKTARIKNQRLYVSTVNTKKIMMSPQTKIQEIKFYGVKIANSIAYVEITNSLKKIGALLMILIAFLIFATIFIINKKTLKQILSSYKERKYDLELWEFIKLSFKKIMKQIFILILQVLSILFILYSVSSFLNVPISYNIDLSSLKSITDAIMSFVNMLGYYFTNGFTDISWLIVKIIMIYVFSSILFWIFSSKYENIKLRKHIKNLEENVEKS